MSKELKQLIDLCECLKATIIRMALDENRAIIQLKDGTPCTLHYMESEGIWV